MSFSGDAGAVLSSSGSALLGFARHVRPASHDAHLPLPILGVTRTSPRRGRNARRARCEDACSRRKRGACCTRGRPATRRSPTCASQCRGRPSTAASTGSPSADPASPATTSSGRRPRSTHLSSPGARNPQQAKTIPKDSAVAQESQLSEGVCCCNTSEQGRNHHGTGCRRRAGAGAPPPLLTHTSRRPRRFRARAGSGGLFTPLPRPEPTSSTLRRTRRARRGAVPFPRAPPALRWTCGSLWWRGSLARESGRFNVSVENVSTCTFISVLRLGIYVNGSMAEFCRLEDQNLWFFWLLQLNWQLASDLTGCCRNNYVSKRFLKVGFNDGYNLTLRASKMGGK